MLEKPFAGKEGKMQALTCNMGITRTLGVTFSISERGECFGPEYP